MKFYLLTFVLVILLGSVLGIILYIAMDRSFDDCIETTNKCKSKQFSKKIKVGIIGDSWVTDNKLEQAILSEMSLSGINAAVVSSGQPGAVTRQVFRNLTAENITKYSSRHFLMDDEINYIVVVAGTNDTVEHIGHDFYAHHMLCIIKAIQSRGIYPIILEIPEYGIDITPPKSFQNYAKRLVYRILFDNSVHNVITSYRQALVKSVNPEMMNSMSIVSTSSFIRSYSESKELFDNPNHLNDEGYLKLGNLISRTIVQVHNKRLKDIQSTHIKK